MDNSLKLTHEQLAEYLQSNVDIDLAGDVHWRNSEGQLHRIYGPAVECNNGSQFWYKHGKLHREDGPAITLAESEGGAKYWYENGKRIKKIIPVNNDT